MQTLAMLFKKKRHLLNSHILHLTFSLIGTLDSGRETSSIPHKAAFENLLCDLEVTSAPISFMPAYLQFINNSRTVLCTILGVCWSDTRTAAVTATLY